MLLTLYLLILLIPLLQGKDPEEVRKIIESELSKYKNHDCYSVTLKNSRYVIVISNVKHIFTYSSKKIKRNDIFYNQLTVYYIFNIEVIVKKVDHNAFSIARTLVMKHSIDYLYILENEMGIYSASFPFKIPHASYDNKIDLMYLDLFEEFLVELREAISSFLFNSLENVLSEVIKQNFHSTYEYLFLRFIQIASDRYYTVEKHLSLDLPERIRFRMMQYKSTQTDSIYSTLFRNITLLADFHFDGADHTTNVLIKSMTFGMFGLTFDTISVPMHSEYLIEIIPQVFNRIFLAIEFKELS